MTEQKLTNYFKRFTAIIPRSEFVARTRMEVTSATQLAPVSVSWFLRMKESVTTGSALALASFMLLIIVGGVSYLAKQGGQVATTTSFNSDALAREAATLSFQVQLNDAEYFDESASQVVRALDQIAGQKTIQ